MEDREKKKYTNNVMTPKQYRTMKKNHANDVARRKQKQ